RQLPRTRKDHRQTLQHAAEMFGQTLALLADVVFVGINSTREAHSNRSPPRVKCLEHVRVAEIDLVRAAARPLRVVPREILIDALARDFERNALLRPRA